MANATCNKCYENAWVTDKPGMFDSKKSAALALGPLLVLSAILWAGIIALVWSVLQ